MGRRRKLSAPAPVVLVTGSSSGIGRAVCDGLARGGLRVYGASRSASADLGWTQLAMDVTDEAAVARGVADVVAREGRLDSLVSCAGVSLAGPVEDTTVAEAQRHFDVNFFGTARVVRAVLPVMRRQGGGKILVIGSIGGLIGLPYLGYYSAAKFALDGLVEALRAEVAAFGIEATVLHPGNFSTALAAKGERCLAASPLSPYHAASERMHAYYTAAERQARSPAVVAHKVRKLLARERLPARTIVGTPLEVLGVWAKTLLPWCGFEYVFRKAYSP
jgi:NAD(P)-dependent dehydrogenase (short-subunit alcohol dehydrogenase family)